MPLHCLGLPVRSEPNQAFFVLWELFRLYLKNPPLLFFVVFSQTVLAAVCSVATHPLRMRHYSRVRVHKPLFVLGKEQEIAKREEEGGRKEKKEGGKKRKINVPSLHPHPLWFPLLGKKKKREHTLTKKILSLDPFLLPSLNLSCSSSSFGPGTHTHSSPPAPGSKKERTSQTPDHPSFHSPPCLWLSPAWHPHLTDAVRGRRKRRETGCGGAKERKDVGWRWKECARRSGRDRETERCNWGPVLLHAIPCCKAPGLKCPGIVPLSLLVLTTGLTKRLLG
ncbi:hypothetical protein TNCV_1799991 [Trichonephila clavipes]|nr:hypothetical protein TNCV_1799991 [Trichonephila clavipes]